VGVSTRHNAARRFSPLCRRAILRVQNGSSLDSQGLYAPAMAAVCPVGMTGLLSFLAPGPCDTRSPANRYAGPPTPAARSTANSGRSLTVRLRHDLPFIGVEDRPRVRSRHHVDWHALGLQWADIARPTNQAPRWRRRRATYAYLTSVSRIKLLRRCSSGSGGKPVGRQTKTDCPTASHGTLKCVYRSWRRTV
jgi:hypothetical protein